MSTKKTTTQDKKTGDAAKVSPQKGQDSGVKTIEGPKSETDQEMKKFMQTILENQRLQAEELKKLKTENEELRKNVSTAENDQSTLDQRTLDDFLEVPVVFFAYSHRPSLFSYRSKGKNLLPPNGPIKFKEQYRYTSGSSFEKRVHTISQLFCSSKREAEFIRSCPDYNVKFFENMSGATRYDHALADVLAKESAKVSQMTDHAVIQAVSNDPRLVVKPDINSMRKELIHARAEDTMKNRKTFENKAAQMAVKDLNELEGTNFIEKVSQLQKSMG